MLSINFIRENPEVVKERLQVKNFKNLDIVDQIVNLDNQRRSIQKQLDDNLAESNNIAKEIGLLFKSNKLEEANILKAKTVELKTISKDTKDKLTEVENIINEKIVLLPNLPHISVPKGKSAEDNDIISAKGSIDFPDEYVPHWDLCSKYNLIDFELGNKLTGSGFPVYRRKGALLQRALINFFVDNAIKKGYTEYQTPLMVNEASAFGTGQLPDKEGQMYYINADNFYMIPTAEVTLTNIYRDTFVKESELPLKLTAYSSCFRREAGSYGKDVRGLNRLHQFDKVEIVQIVKPEDSYKVLEEMKDYVASLLEMLELPYRILRLCGGDISFASALTYDLEVFSGGQKKWLEVSSVSNFETFQSLRMNIKYKDSEGKNKLVHTLNGSALALPRIVASLMENNQTANGIKVPLVLQEYTKTDIIN